MVLYKNRQVDAACVWIELVAGNKNMYFVQQENSAFEIGAFIRGF